MSSGIIFNGGTTGGGGNPYSLGINIPAPIVRKFRGNLQSGNLNNNVKLHGADIFYNGQKGVYNEYSILGITMPNIRYNQPRNNYGVNTDFFQDINKLNPKIFMFKWNRNGLGHKGNLDSKQTAVYTRGTWSHPPNIINSEIVPTYTNFSAGKLETYYPSLYTIDNPLTNPILARSEFDINYSGQYDVQINLDTLNPFRFYKNLQYGRGSSVNNAYFNSSQDFFGTSYDNFTDWIKNRQRNGANNWLGYNNFPAIYKPTQSDFNVYLSFALVIQNPLNRNQYIIGQLSKPVKQSLLMGYNSGNNKVPKAFKYYV